MEAIATEAQLEIGQLGELALCAYLILWPAMDLVHANHEAFISHRRQTVELWRIAQFLVASIATRWLRQVKPVSVGPKHRLVPVGSFQELVALHIVTGAPAWSVFLDALYPFLAERIVEDRTVVSCRPRAGHRLRP